MECRFSMRMCEVGGGKERMTAYFNGFNGYCTTGWPEGYTTPTTEELTGAKGSVDPQRLELVKGMHARKTELFQELIGSGVVPPSWHPSPRRRGHRSRRSDRSLLYQQRGAVRTLVKTLMGDERYAKFEFSAGTAVLRKKPNPDVYNLAAETMGLEKSECVVIEDSGIGNKAAKAVRAPGSRSEALCLDCSLSHIHPLPETSSCPFPARQPSLVTSVVWRAL